jgi:hypothetical protein
VDQVPDGRRGATEVLRDLGDGEQRVAVLSLHGRTLVKHERGSSERFSGRMGDVSWVIGLPAARTQLDAELVFGR